jgi:hypothetical protein
MINEANKSDHAKFAYHEGARIIRSVLNRICEMTYKSSAPSPDERETLCDILIELHQLLYDVTLYTLRPSLGEDPHYEDDEVYSHGRPVIRRTVLPIPTADRVYCGSIGEDIPPGGRIAVWHPGDLTHPVLTEEEAAVGTAIADRNASWKRLEDLRARGLIERIPREEALTEKEADTGDLVNLLLELTDPNRAVRERRHGESPSDSAETEPVRGDLDEDHRGVGQGNSQ